MASVLTYRLLREKDLPGIHRLWGEVGWAWGDSSSWREWYLHRGPYQRHIIAIAEDDRGEIAAQMEFHTSRVQLADRAVWALRIAAPILRKDLQTMELRKIDHPLARLFMFGLDQAHGRYGLLYAWPRSEWVPIFRWAAEAGICQFHLLEKSCWRLAIRPPHRASDPAHTVAAEATGFGREHDDLWRRARRSLPIECGVIRDRRWLQSNLAGKTTIEVRDRCTRTLVGYAAVRKQDGLLFDVLAATSDDLQRVLSHTLRWIQDHRASSVSPDVHYLKAMAGGKLEDPLRALDFVEDDFSFLFACCPLGPTLLSDAPSLDEWYLTPGD